MDIQKEAELRSRVLAAAMVLADAYRVEVPAAFGAVSGNRFERELQRLEATAVFLEALVLETAQPGLSKKLDGYTDLRVLRSTEDDDLMQIDGVGKGTVKAIRKALSREADGEDISQSELVREGNEEPDREGKEGNSQEAGAAGGSQG